MNKSTITTRKDDHIRINLNENVQSGLKTGFEKYHFIHRALPELDFLKIELVQRFFNKTVNLPIMISSMIGGTPEAARINKMLAQTAQEFGLAMGLGSQRISLEDQESGVYFDVRKDAPDILLFANIGAVQLNYGLGIDDCKKIVDMVAADGLILHLNPLQEVIQPEGNTNFSNLLSKIGTLCKKMEVPVIVKEVGWGISAVLGKRLIDVGVAGIDIAGAGGTSWSQVERFRLSSPSQIEVAEAFIDWGIPTADGLLKLRENLPNALLIASGGIKTGMDTAKALALGANMVGLAGEFLRAANHSQEALVEKIYVIEKIIRISMFATGSSNLASFSRHKIKKSYER